MGFEIKRKFLQCECCNFLAVIPCHDEYEGLICPFCHRTKCDHGGKFIEIDKTAFLKEAGLTSRPSRAAKHDAFDKFDQQFKDGEPKPFLFT